MPIKKINCPLKNIILILLSNNSFSNIILMALRVLTL
jgi:hypothetical protein